MIRVWFEPLDLEVENVEQVKDTWKSLQKQLVSKGILLPDIMRIRPINSEGFVIERVSQK